MSEANELPELSEAEREALHSVELGVEWLRRAHGDLLGVHHKTGHAMDHFARAEEQLCDCGYEGLAEALRCEHLPRGAVDDRWTYDLVETFEAGLLADLTGFEEQAREAVADGHRHVAERHQERAWRERAGEATEGE
jgi:hypothetical protein